MPGQDTCRRSAHALAIALRPSVFGICVFVLPLASPEFGSMKSEEESVLHWFIPHRFRQDSDSCGLFCSARRWPSTENEKAINKSFVNFRTKNRRGAAGGIPRRYRTRRKRLGPCFLLKILFFGVLKLLGEVPNHRNASLCFGHDVFCLNSDRTWPSVTRKQSSRLLDREPLVQMMLPNDMGGLSS